MGWVGDVARMGGIRKGSKILVGKPEENHLGDVGVDLGIILKWILKKQGLDSVDSGNCPVVLSTVMNLQLP
jgi:hypothetical protein